jgi:hypothetical protein
MRKKPCFYCFSLTVQVLVKENALFGNMGWCLQEKLFLCFLGIVLLQQKLLVSHGMMLERSSWCYHVVVLFLAEMRCLRPENVHRSEKERAKCRRHRILPKKNMCRGVFNLSQPGTRRQSLPSNVSNHCKKLVNIVFS